MADSPQPEAVATSTPSRWPDWPEAALSDDLVPFIDGAHRAGRRVALATLVQVEGSSPRPLGAEMAIADDGCFSGYVSGGCIEASVVAESRAVLAEGRSKRLVYGRGSPFLDIVLACGGRIEVLLRRLEDPAAYVDAIVTARRARQALTMLSPLDGGAPWFEPGDRGTGRHVVDGRECFARKQLPSTRLVIVGGGPEALALARLAPAFDIETRVLRPQGPAAPPATPPLRYERGPLSPAFEAQPPDAWTAVYALSHDLDLDAAALGRALPSTAFVVGALGSRGRADLLRARLRADGLDEAAVSRLRAPAGLDLGATTPMEIALSIVGQIVSARPR